MTKTALFVALGATLVLGACGKGAGNSASTGQTPAAVKAAGARTIAGGLPANSQFMAAARSVGLDKTLAGPGPYTVLVPSDAAFATLPQGTLGGGADPKQRTRVTGLLTYLILPGTVLAADIANTVDNGKGKALMMTVGGQTLNAGRDANGIVLSDSSGHSAHITQADQQFSNGVVHQIDAVLMPSAAPAGTPPGK